MELHNGCARQVVIQRSDLLARQLPEESSVRDCQSSEYLSPCVVLVGRVGPYEGDAVWYVVDDVCGQDGSVWLGEEGDDGYESVRSALHDLLDGFGVSETVDCQEGQRKEKAVRRGGQGMGGVSGTELWRRGC